jgi:uncharacterized protein (TIGR04255 family)
MGQKMSRAPVYYALAQVRFNAVAALDQYVGAVQDNLRKAGYPDFERGFFATIALAPSSAAQGSVPQPLSPQARYTFLNEERTSGFVLDQSMMFFQTTDYDTHEPFFVEFLKGLNFLHTATQLSYSERVGVRFLDAVCPSAGENLSHYLVPSVMGIFDKLEPRELTFAISETRTKLDQTQLMSRVTILNQDQEGAAFPFDLQPVTVKVLERFSKIKGLYGVIDTDCWLDQREKFSTESLEKRLKLLHREVRRSFEMTATPYAMKAWK